MAQWWNLGLEVDGEDALALSDLLEELGAVAVTLNAADDSIIAVSAHEVAEEQHWPRTKVTALLPLSTEPDALLAALREQAPHYIQGEATRERFADQDWIAAFRQRFEPIRFGNLGVRASWSPAFDPPIHDIAIDPGMAFGTGAHATTALCLQALAELQNLADQTVIDYGCGSGLLAIAAAKLGAGEVLAVDIDPQACRIAIENAARNAVAEAIRVGDPTLCKGTRAQLVVANILLGPLTELRETILALLPPGGQLIMSGITEDQVDVLMGHYREALSDVETQVHEGWARVSGIKTGELSC